MAIPVIIYGRSGTGKSTSIRTFLPGEAAVIKVIDKPLPFPAASVPQVTCQDVDGVIAALTACPARSIVIDDAGYLMTRLYMARPRGAGTNTYAVYDGIGDAMWRLMTTIMDMAHDTIVFIIMHEDVSDMTGQSKILTIGKLVDSKINLPGMVTITLHALVKDGKYIFKTQSDGYDVAKSPMGMFLRDDGVTPATEIDNDLAAVDRTIRAYYHID